MELDIEAERLPKGLQSGLIRFVDYCQPALKLGEYQIVVNQDLDYGDPHGKVTGHVPQVFDVVAPQVVLEGGDVYSVYPPGNSVGPYEDTLSHVVLRRRTLPWARSGPIVPDKPDSVTPWVALLLFYDSTNHQDRRELPMPGGADGDGAVTMKARDFIKDAPGVKVPKVQLSEGTMDSFCRAIEVDGDVFTRIAPTCKDLAWLAHARKVSIEDKDILGLEEEEWFSVVIANRMPQVGKNIVHLVSLEGLGPFLPDPATKQRSPELPPAAKLRMLSLASWSFHCREDDKVGDRKFGYLIKNIDVGLLRVARPDGADAQDTAGKAIDAGYVPLAYGTRHGEETVAWYRGPFTTALTGPDAMPPRYEAAEQAMIYDPKLGMFHVSFAVAWQIGRLLALSDRTFSKGLLVWQRQGHRLVDLLEARVSAFSHLRTVLSFPNTLGGRMQPRLLEGLLSEFLGGPFCKILREREPALPEWPLSREAVERAVREGRDPHDLLRELLENARK